MLLSKRDKVEELSPKDGLLLPVISILGNFLVPVVIVPIGSIGVMLGVR